MIHKELFINNILKGGCINDILVINAITGEIYYENTPRSVSDLLGYTGNTNMPEVR